MRPRRFLVLAALVAGAAAQAVADRLVGRASVTTAAPAKAALPRAAGLLAAGAGVVWAQLGGDVYRSSDGGRRFRASLPEAVRVARCGCAGPAFFLGTRDAWVVRSAVTGDGALQQATVWQTTDGGRIWRAGSAVPGLPSPLSVAVLSYSLSFATPEVGYLLGSGTDLGTGSTVGPRDPDFGRLVSLLWETSDGGRTWRQVIARELPAAPSNPGSPANCGATSWLAVSFASARVGFVADACAPGLGLLQTTDGGKDWREADLERPPGGWPEYAQFGLPTVTADGAVLESPSGLDRATDEGGWLVVERLTTGGSFRYAGRVQTDGLMTTGLDAVDATGSRLALLAAGRLPAEGYELFESSDGGVSWRLAGHEVVNGGAGSGAPSSAPALAEDAALAVLPEAGKQPAARSAHGPVVEALLLNANLMAAEGQDAGGAVDLTSDSGRTWKQALRVVPQPAALSPYDDVAFASARLGYLAGPAGVAVTTDGGEHVAPVLRLGTGEQVLRLEVTGRLSAVVVTTHRLLVTADGGRRWQARTEPSDLAADVARVEPAAVEFVSPRVGFASSCSYGPSAAALERTLDGGRSWQALAIPAGSRCGGSGPSLCVASSRVLYDLVVPATAAVDCAGSTGPLDAILYASDDGASWRRVGPAPDALLACSGSALWADTSAGAAMGFEPYVVFRSRDGGRSFAAVAGTVAKTARFGDFGGPYPAMTLTHGELDTLSAFGSDAAVLMTDCWACQPGFDLAVSVTTDGGAAWSRPDDVLAAAWSDSPEWVSFVSPRVGFVLGVWSQGPGDVLVATSDGGSTWRQLAVFGASN